MEIRALRSLLRIGESGSIRQTAASVHLSPAAVHKQLKTLEEELGVRLYEKVGGRLRLTAAGDVTIPYVREMLAQHDAAVAAITEWKGLGSGLVRIGAGPTIAGYLLPPLLKRFRGQYPGIELVVDTGSTSALLAALASGDLDVAFLLAGVQGEDDWLRSNLAWEFEIVLVAGSQAAPRRCSIRDLGNYPFILFKKTGRIEACIERYLDRTGFAPRVSMRLDNADAVKAMARAGLGLAMLPYWTVAAEVARKQIHLIRQKEEPLISRILLVSRKAGYTPRPVETFIGAAQAFDTRKMRLRTR
jgi:DNA-binding transcriptional LysR family regulator